MFCLCLVLPLIHIFIFSHLVFLPISFITNKNYKLQVKKKNIYAGVFFTFTPKFCFENF